QMMGLFDSDVKVINFAICWNIFIYLSTLLIINNVKILNFRQSAGNRNGSSETTRKINYFIYYENFQPQQIKDINPDFLSWFVGFTEGDGSFITDNKRNIFIIVQKDPKILYYIKTNLGFGSVIKRKDGYFIFRVTDQINIDRLIRIFYGNLQLNKTNLRFKNWEKVYINYRKLNNKLDFSNIPNNNLISLKNGWLSGFIDAEGCFNSSFRNKITYSLRLKFILDQKGEIDILEKILSLLDNNHLKIYDRINIKTMQRIIITSNFSILFNYLDHYPLKSNKIIDYKRFLRIYNYKLLPKKEYLEIISNPKSFYKLENLIKSINKE
uniref:LAGLIDADG endonuclease n=1 Tax=Amoeboaphelidium protococcarum TaxID=1243177 RepID=UPI002238CACB